MVGGIRDEKRLKNKREMRFFIQTHKRMLFIELRSTFLRVAVFAFAGVLLFSGCLVGIEKAFAAEGSVYIARAPATNLITNLGATETSLTYDTEVKTSADITRQTGNQSFRIGSSGRYLVIANTRFSYVDIENNNRHVVRTQIKVGGTALPSVYGMASGFGRDSGSADEDGAVVTAYVDHTYDSGTLTNNDITFHVQNFGDTSISLADQLANQSGVQIVRLPDDSDYLQVQRTTDISFTGTMDYSLNDSTWNDFGFESQDAETDTGVIEWVAASANYGAYITEVLSDSPFYTYLLDDTTLLNVASSGYTGGANSGGTLVGDGLIDEFADALEGNAFDITTSNADEINLATTIPSETIEAIVRIDDTTSLQTIYEQGGGSRGISLSIQSGYLYFSAWNNPTTDGAGDAWGASTDHVYSSVAIPSTGTYYVAGVYAQESGDDNFDGELRVYIGDVTDVSSGLTSNTYVGTGTAGSGGVGKLYAHSGDAHWADNSDAFIGSSGVTTAPSSFDGALNAIALYDDELSSTQLGDHFAASDDETAPIAISPDTITLKESGHYMVIYSVRSDASGSNRQGAAYRLRLDATEVPASTVLSYMRSTDGSEESWVQWGGIVNATADDILNIDWASASETAGGFLNEATMTVIRLPDTADYLRIRYDSSRAGETTGVYPFNQEDEDDAGVHDNTTNNSRISGDSDDHDWLLFGSWFARTSSVNANRVSEHFRWYRTGTEVQYGSGLSYHRGDQSTTGVPAGGRNMTIVADSLGTGEYMEINLLQESGTGDQGRDFIANRVGVTGVAIDTLVASTGSLSVDIVDAAGASVSSPSVSFATKDFSWNTQTSAGILGTSTEKIRLTNTTTTSTWSLELAATDGSSAVWDGATYSYDFNDSAANGRLEIDASGATITPQSGCNSTGLSKGTSTYFSQGVTDSITVLSAGATAGTSCYWDYTGIDLTQDIPAGQEADTYTIDMTLTAS